MEEVTQCSRNILDSHHPEHCISFSISSFIMRLSLIAFKYLLVCLLSGRMLESEWPEWWKRKAMWEGWTTVIFFWDFTHLDHWLGCSLKETKNCKWILAALGKYIEYFSVYFLSIRENKSPWKKKQNTWYCSFHYLQKFWWIRVCNLIPRLWSEVFRRRRKVWTTILVQLIVCFIWELLWKRQSSSASSKMQMKSGLYAL